MAREEQLKCPVCGGLVGKYYSDELSIKEKGMCFGCEIWSKRVEELKNAPQHKIAIIDGTYYTIGDEDSKSYFRGFGGARFQIEFNDGYRIITTNLWCGGDIDSSYWRKQLPDNARFERNLKWKKIGETNYLVEE